MLVDFFWTSVPVAVSYLLESFWGFPSFFLEVISFFLVFNFLV